MLKEFKKPMWNDGPAKQPWLNYFNEYELQHCCFGSDGNGPDGEGGTHANISTVTGKDAGKTTDDTPVGTVGTTVQDVIDITEGPTISDPNEQTLAPEGYDPDRSFTKTTDSYGNLTGFVSDAGTKFSTNPDTGELEIDTSGRMGPDGTIGGPTDIGYNDLVDLGYFDALDLDVEANARAKADQIEMDAKYNGLDVTVGVDKDGNFSYSGPDAAEVALGEIGSGIKSGFGALTDMAKGLTSITPEGLVMGALTGTGPGGGLTRAAIGEYNPVLGGLLSGGKFKADPYDSPSMRAYAKELEDEDKRKGKTVEEVVKEKEKENPFTIPLNKGGVVYRDGGGTTSEDNKPFEFSMADYFKNQKTAPFYSTKPNEYLVALQRQIYPDITTDEIYRRLGYRPAPDPDDTSSTTSYYNNPYGMNI